MKDLVAVWILGCCGYHIPGEAVYVAGLNLRYLRGLAQRPFYVTWKSLSSKGLEELQTLGIFAGITAATNPFRP